MLSVFEEFTFILVNVTLLNKAAFMCLFTFFRIFNPFTHNVILQKLNNNLFREFLTSVCFLIPP